MKIIKNILLTKNNLARKIEEAVRDARGEETRRCELEKQKILFDIKSMHNDELEKKEKIIKYLQKKHSNDIKAYSLFREKLEIVSEIYEKLEEVSKGEFTKVANKYREFRNEVDRIQAIVRNVRRIAPKIEKLHGGGK